MILEIQHETSLEYSHAVREWLTELRMEPVSDERQRCHSFQIVVSQPANLAKYVDGFGNRVHHFNLISPQQKLRILAASVVETEVDPVNPMNSEATFPVRSEELPLEALDFLTLTGPVVDSPLLTPLLEQLAPRERGRIGMWACQVAEYIRSHFEYARDITDATSPIDVVLRERKGVCQDFTHLMIAILRSNGVPARYVSGYIHRPNKDSQSHAWCEVWLQDVGWVGFDPTNGCPTNDRFVKTAVGRDFTDVPPNKGIFRGEGTERINVRVATRQLDRLPSVRWQDQLPPLDVPSVALTRRPLETAAEEQIQQQQQQQQ
jgi:transglutaminase-like putative cysteine protease